MKYVPAISSTISPQFLAELVREKYGLNQVICKVIRVGINHTYLIETDGEKYILRIYTYNWRTEQEVEGEIKLLNLLKETVSVSYPIQDEKGDYIQKINAVEGIRLMVLFSYAKGEIQRNPSKEICYHLGVEMAKMHQITLDKQFTRIDYNEKTLTGWVLEAVKKHFPEPSSDLEYIERARQMVANQFREADFKQLRSGIVHLDIWSDNLKIGDNSKITLFDFDNCGNGWLFLDIAYTIMLLFKEEADKAIFEEKKGSFYQGYESISPITDEEKRLLPYGGLAIWLHYTGIHARRFNDFSSLFFSRNFLKAWLNLGNNWLIYNEIEV